jgi:hypothetical protein
MKGDEIAAPFRKAYEPPARDEFETIGLQRYRDTEGWIEHT